MLNINTSTVEMCIHGLPLSSGAIPMTSPVIPADFTILARNLLLSGVYCMRDWMAGRIARLSCGPPELMAARHDSLTHYRVIYGE